MPYLLKEFVTHMYQHLVFYVLCLSMLVLHMKSKDKMPLKQFESVLITGLDQHKMSA